MTCALSVIASLTAVGFGVGIVLAGPIVDALGYHWLFWLPMVVTTSRRWPRCCSSPSRRCVRRGGSRSLPAVLLSGWLVALLLALSEGNQWGWGSPRSSACSRSRSWSRPPGSGSRPACRSR